MMGSTGDYHWSTTASSAASGDSDYSTRALSFSTSGSMPFPFRAPQQGFDNGTFHAAAQRQKEAEAQRLAIAELQRQSVAYPLIHPSPHLASAAQGSPAAAVSSSPRKAGMLKELFGDFRGYVKDNRDLIFSIVFVLVLDEYVFKGAFRERLKGVIAGVLKKVEEKTGVDISGV